MKNIFLIALLFSNAYAQSFECDNNFSDCGTPEQSGGGGGGKGSVLIANTDLGDSYQSADGNDRGQFISGMATDALATTGLEFYSSSGNISAGKFSLFGVNG